MDSTLDSTLNSTLDSTLDSALDSSKELEKKLLKKTYPDSDHEFTEINLTTAILVKEIEKNSNLLWVQVDSHLAQTLIQLLRVNLSVVVLVD